MNRGEIWLADLGYMGKVRPVLVLSIPPGSQDRALVTCVIRTTSTRGTAFEVPHLAGLDEMTGEMTRLFNPRADI